MSNTTAINQIEVQLANLGLFGMREGYGRRFKQALSDDLGVEDFLTTLLHDEAEYRRSNRIKRLLRNAGFRQGATCEAIDFSSPRGIDKKQLRDLSQGRHISDGINLIVMGPTGAGKTYLATALGNAACRDGHTTIFYRMNILLEQIALVRAKGTYLHFLKKLAAADLMIIDDFGIKPLTPNQFQDFYDILDERGESKSIILTTQLPVENWSEVIGDPVTCESITDRLAARAIRIQMKGESYRKKAKVTLQENIDKIDPP
ncbi:MAG: IS21-like element helper ATPase IstB [Pseudomonadota bacterium]|nr:IS21-like element helper ATPase IstB [Pseudomonadota bacterium]